MKTKKRQEPRTNSIFNKRFIVTDKPLVLNAICWNEKVRLEASVNSPFDMSFMLDLDREQAQELERQIHLSIADIPAPKRKSKGK
jgi:hypothetical protein